MVPSFSPMIHEPTGPMNEMMKKKRDGSKKTSKGLEGFGDLLFTDGTRR